MRAVVVFFILTFVAFAAAAGSFFLTQPVMYSIIAGGVGALFALLAIITAIVSLLRPKKKRAKHTMAAVPPRLPTDIPSPHGPGIYSAPPMQPRPPQQLRPIAPVPSVPQAPTQRPVDTAHIFVDLPDFESTGDEDEDNDRMLMELRDTKTKLRAVKRQRPQLPLHLEPVPAERDTRPQLVAFTPFATEEEMIEARESSQVLHVPESMSAAKKRKQFMQSKNHGNNGRKKPNRGGGNYQRYTRGA